MSSFVYSQEIFRGDIFISDLSSSVLDTTYILKEFQMATGSREPQQYYTMDNVVYEIKFSIKIYGNEYTYSNALAITFKTPDNQISTFIINQDLYPLTFDEEYEYIFNLHSRETGWVNVELNEWDIHTLEIKNNIYVNFLNYDFYIE